MQFWQTSRRKIPLGKPLVMAILNVTPDSFSDGGKFSAADEALRRAERLIDEGADILDIGGESTRPNSGRVDAAEETRRVVPVIEAVCRRFEIAVSIDTTKSEVARRACEAGAEIVNDVSGLRFDETLGEIAARYRTGLILMHLRGDFETMHRQPPVAEILPEVAGGFRESLETARKYGVDEACIALDVGIGFSKTFEQNLELLARLDRLTTEFAAYPILTGTSRKSFLGRILDDAPADQRLEGSLASASIAVWNGARIVRAHDVRETVAALRVVAAVRNQL